MLQLIARGDLAMEDEYDADVSDCSGRVFEIFIKDADLCVCMCAV